jgi:predicted RecB family nuclease
MLEAAGLAAPDGRHGGIIGVEHRVVWYDLDALIWRTPSSSDHQKSRTTMERYDFEFDFRLDIIATAGLHEADPTVDPLVVPVRVSECAECPWWGHCEPLLETGTGDVSLIPRIGWREWKIHQDHGTTDREALARLDVATACLVAAGVDVLSLIELVEGLPENTPLTELAVVAKKADLAMLEAAGVRTFGQVSQLSRATASYSGAGLSSLPEQIDMARAALGPAPVYRRRGVDTLFVPRAEIEVDIDMENIEEGVYLWGALVTDQSSASDHPSEYHAFVTWEPLTPEVEAANSLRFWNWLSGLRIDAQETGRSFHSYCYNASAENTYLRKLGLAAGILHEVAAFIASDDWIDMLRVFDRQLITGGGSGLKVVAPLAGFAWSVDDPGGGESMVRYDVAVSSPNDARRAEARHWLLTYNEGDVKATLALREWMDHAAPQATAIESLHSRS